MDVMALQFALPGWQHLIMYVIGLTLIFLAVNKDYEPMLLLPIGFGAILVNLPLAVVLTAGRSLDPFVTRFVAEHPDAREFFERTLKYVFEGGQAFKTEPGVLSLLFDAGIITELFPVLIFIAIGAMCDFTPLFKMPQMIFFGAAAQFGIFATLIVALLLGFDMRPAVAISIIGAADGPTSIYVATRLARDYLGPISVAAYSYMALVPLIQPPVIRMLTTREERRIKMSYQEADVSRTARVAFPIVVTFVAAFIAPISVPLVGFLMLGNLIRESGVLERLSKAAQNELANLVTLLLGVTIGATMTADKFIRVQTVMILGLGLAAFIFDTAGGVLIAKLFNIFSRTKVNPMIGASGISAFPMSARVVHRMAQAEDGQTWILMQAVSANVAGQLGSVVAGGVLLALVPLVLR
jgi:sodium ion-translocating decarboxylase beta subunit